MGQNTVHNRSVGVGRTRQVQCLVTASPLSIRGLAEAPESGKQEEQFCLLSASAHWMCVLCSARLSSRSVAATGSRHPKAGRVVALLQLQREMQVAEAAEAAEQPAV